jgi:hypothetical protein
MLSPTDIHYLISILISMSQTEEVEIELGSLLYDEKAEIDRDIDITVKLVESGSEVKIFTGIEVKAEKCPLDVQVVEQLIYKAVKIPSIAELNIVSASGYSAAVRTLARNCNGDPSARGCRIKLFELKDWTDENLFEQFKFLPDKTFDEWILEWDEIEECYFDSELPDFSIGYPKMIFDAAGKPLITPNSLFEQSSRQWLSQFKNQIPAERIIPDVPIGVHADVFYSNEVYGLTEERLIPVKKLTIVGAVVWRKFEHQITRKVLVATDEQSPLAGAMLGINNNGDILCFALSASNRSLSHFLIPLKYRQMKKVKRIQPFAPQPFNLTPLFE